MNPVKRYVRLYFVFFSQFVKKTMANKVDFFIGLISYLLRQAIGILFLFLVFRQIPDLNGWSLDQMLFIYGYAQMTFGLDHFVSDYLWRFARQTVREGLFDRYLLRPVGALFQVLMEMIQTNGLGEILVGVVLLVWAGASLQLTVTFGFVLLMVVGILAGAAIIFGLKLAAASTAFFTKDSYSLLFFVHNLTDFTKYPTEIYAKPVRVVLTYILPYAFSAFIPASYFLGHSNAWAAIGGAVLAAVVVNLLAQLVYRAGVNRYESAGN